jgi:hypothetical protein
MGQAAQYALVYPNDARLYRDGILAVKSEPRGRSFRLVAINGRHQESAVSKSQTTMRRTVKSEVLPLHARIN